MKRLILNSDKLKKIKDDTKVSYQELNRATGKVIVNYIFSKNRTPSIEKSTAIIIAKKLNCKVEDFTSDTYVNPRLGNNHAGKPKYNPPTVIVPQSWSEVLPNGVIFIHAPFMET